MAREIIEIQDSDDERDDVYARGRASGGASKHFMDLTLSDEESPGTHIKRNSSPAPSASQRPVRMSDIKATAAARFSRYETEKLDRNSTSKQRATPQFHQSVSDGPVARPPVTPDPFEGLGTPSAPVQTDARSRADSPRRLMTEARRISLGQSEELQAEAALSAIEETLRSVQQELIDHHATYTKYLLLDAKVTRDRLQVQTATFCDKVSPFAGMKSIATASTESPSKLLLKHTIVKKSLKSKSLIPLKGVRSKVDRVPKYEHFVEINNNFLVSDARTLGFTPFFGDNHGTEARRKLLEDLKKSYEMKKAEDPLYSRKVELARQLQNFLPRILDQLSISKLDLLAAIQPLPQSNETMNQFIDCFEDIFQVDIRYVCTEETSSTSSVPAVSTAQEVLETAIDHACHVCHVHECLIHGDYRSRDNSGSTQLIDYKPFVLRYSTVMARRAENLARPRKRTSFSVPPFADEEPCANTCFLNNKISGEISTNWSKADVLDLHTLMLPIRKGRTCTEVHYKLMVSPPAQEARSEIPRSSTALPWYDNKTKKIRHGYRLNDETRTHEANDRERPEGCEHEGQSCEEAGGENCNCVAANVLCDKHCGCPSDCHIRFTGCNCAQTLRACSTGTCPCYELNRECDPDLCGKCGAIEAANPVNHPYSLPSKICHNTSLQRGVYKSLVIGESSIPGRENGVYIAENCPKGSFIAEYVGEIISDSEVERRWHIYNQKKLSYIFDLNAQWSIDAARYGNKLRFMNHSNDPNVGPKVMLVNMVHRIGFWAMRDLHQGEELFFDYGKGFDPKIFGLYVGGQGKGKRGESDVKPHGTDKGTRKLQGKIARKSTVSGAKPLQSLPTLSAPQTLPIVSGSPNRPQTSGSRGTAGSPSKVPAWAKTFVPTLHSESEPSESESEYEDDDMDSTVKQRQRKRRTKQPKKYTR